MSYALFRGLPRGGTLAKSNHQFFANAYEDCEAWYSAEHSVVSANSGDTIANINDLVGDYHLAQAGAIAGVHLKWRTRHAMLLQTRYAGGTLPVSGANPRTMFALAITLDGSTIKGYMGIGANATASQSFNIGTSNTNLIRFVGYANDYVGSLATPVGVPTMLAATYDGTTLDLYVNGTAAGNNTKTLNTQGSSGGVALGGYPYSASADPGRVMILEAAIYSRVMFYPELREIFAELQAAYQF